MVSYEYHYWVSFRQILKIAYFRLIFGQFPYIKSQNQNPMLPSVNIWDKNLISGIWFPYTLRQLDLSGWTLLFEEHLIGDSRYSVSMGWDWLVHDGACITEQNGVPMVKSSIVYWIAQNLKPILSDDKYRDINLNISAFRMWLICENTWMYLIQVYAWMYHIQAFAWPQVWPNPIPNPINGCNNYNIFEHMYGLRYQHIRFQMQIRWFNVIHFKKVK